MSNTIEQQGANALKAQAGAAAGRLLLRCVDRLLWELGQAQPDKERLAIAVENLKDARLLVESNQV